VKKLIATGLAALTLAGVGSGVALGTSQYGNVFNAYQPNLLLGQVRGQADFDRADNSAWTRFQVRLLKNGVQKGSIVTFGAPNANVRGTVNYPCYLGSGNWTTQVRGVSTSGTVTVWDTSIARAINCG
jgi:hypothetical protein